MYNEEKMKTKKNQTSNKTIKLGRCQISIKNFGKGDRNGEREFRLYYWTDVFDWARY